MTAPAQASTRTATATPTAIPMTVLFPLELAKLTLSPPAEATLEEITSVSEVVDAAVGTPVSEAVDAAVGIPVRDEEEAVEIDSPVVDDEPVAIAAVGET